VARILVDTSAVFALVDRSDANHAAARVALAAMRKRRTEPLLTNFIVAESHALLLARMGATIARAWLLGNAWPIERVTEEDEARARAIVARYEDKSYSYTDATSFAVMERRGLKVAFAFDPHFRQHGFQLLDLEP
jgi:predicted nucleic acid-binding protein